MKKRIKKKIEKAQEKCPECGGIDGVIVTLKSGSIKKTFFAYCEACGWEYKLQNKKED